MSHALKVKRPAEPPFHVILKRTTARIQKWKPVSSWSFMLLMMHETWEIRDELLGYHPEIRRFELLAQIKRVRKLVAQVAIEDPDKAEETLFLLLHVVWEAVFAHAGSDGKRHQKLVTHLTNRAKKSWKKLNELEPFTQKPKDIDQLGMLALLDEVSTQM